MQMARCECLKGDPKGGGRQVRTLTGHTGTVMSVAFSPNDNRVVSGSTDKLVKIWDTETGFEVCSHERAFSEEWNSSEFPGDGKLRFQALPRFE